MRRLAILLFAGVIGLIAVQYTVNIMGDALDVFEHAIALGGNSK